ncbi:MAG: DMT family transporter [Sulfuritalea sp.]|nr:DMT family transporter [Sulfuritalea sp.]
MTKIYPVLFVFLWSTGFLGAKYGLPYAEPLTFLLVRFILVTMLMTCVAIAFRAPWPHSGRHWFHIGVTGVLMHSLYIGGVFVAIDQGLPAGVCSLIVGLQPILTALSAGLLLHERVGARQWLGLVLGFVGIILVLWGRISGGFGLNGLLPALGALISITVGTIYQKKFCPNFDWRTGSVAQFIPATIATAILASMTESFRIEFQPPLVFALAWLVIILSVVAVRLLNHLIKSGSATHVASLFYLVPASTTGLAWILFDEMLTPLSIAGMCIALWGVNLSRK